MISVVVPVHDEERSVALLYDELRSALEPLDTPWEAIFVDDGSTDGTFSALTRLHAAEQNVRVVRLRRNFGKAAALVAGFDQVRGETVVTIDGDLQDDPAEIPRLLAKLDEGFDLVSGWKTRRRDPLSRRILSRIFNRVTSAFSGVRLHDMNCGLKAYRAEVVHGLRLYGELHRFIPVLAHYRGFRIAELPVNHRPREHGRSRYGVERYVRGFLDLLTVSFIGRYRHRPLHLFGGLGLILGFIGSAILVYLTVVKALGHAIGQRPLLLLGVLLVVIGMQFFSLGLISEMITSHHVEPARHGVGQRARALRPTGGAKLLLSQGGEPLEQPDVDRLAAAEVVVHEPAGNAGGARDVLDRDLVVGALGEQRVGRVEDLVAPLPGIEAAERRGAHKRSVNVIGALSRGCYRCVNKDFKTLRKGRLPNAQDSSPQERRSRCRLHLQGPPRRIPTRRRSTALPTGASAASSAGRPTGPYDQEVVNAGAGKALRISNADPLAASVNAVFRAGRSGW